MKDKPNLIDSTKRKNNSEPKTQVKSPEPLEIISFSQSEDIVFLIDFNPNFYKPDILPTRFLKFKEILDDFLERRIQIDPSGRILLIPYNCPKLNITHEFNPISDPIAQNFLNISNIMELENSKIEFLLNDALKLAMQKLIAVFKTIRDRTLRLIIISNEVSKQNPQFYQKILDIINGVGCKLDVIFDIVCFNKDFVGDKSLLGLFKTVRDKTNGSLYEIENEKSFTEAFSKIVEKKDVLIQEILGKKMYTEPQEFLEIIASDLLQIDEILDDSELICQICFTKECACQGILDFYTHGRKCPNCGKIMHLCCAGKWAENQNLEHNYIGFPTVLRCPFCFYLLKVPKEFVNFDEILEKLQKKYIESKKKFEERLKSEQIKIGQLESFSEELRKAESEKANISAWLREHLPNRKEREIERISDEIVRLPTYEEKVSFINYLKFSNDIDNDSMPI